MGFLDQFNAFHDLAAAAVNLEDFGSEDYREPMRLLLENLDKYTRTTEAGAQSIAQEIVGLLVGRLIMQKGNLQLQEPVVPEKGPLFIVGMTRTGSTVLHRLLSQDPGVQALPLWLGSMPVPRPPRETWSSHPYFQMAESGLKHIDDLNPNFRIIHPMDAAEPDECRFAMNQTFWASSLIATACVPDYFDWMVQTDAGYAYEYYRKLLAYVANGDSRPWVLKDPSHLYGLDSLLKVFPNACIVQTHRDPLEAIASVTNLVRQVRGVREAGLTLESQRDQAMQIWPGGLNKFERIRQQSNPKQFFDVHINELRADPIGTLEQIYDYFGFPVTTESREAWLEKRRSDPDAGHKIKHKPVDFGFKQGELIAALGDYYQRYQSVLARAEQRLAG